MAIDLTARRLLTLAALVLAAGRADADVLTGTIATKVRQGAPAATAVVYAEPLGGTAPIRPAAAVSIEQKDKTFLPHVLAVPVGTTVRFPNSDGIFHNVFSLSPGNAFDLGLYRSGASKSRTLAKPGLVRVFCNIHPQMTAVVVAAPTPWVVAADGGGAWRLELPAGRYRLTALSERAAAVSIEVEVSGTTTAPALTLDESGFAAVPHLNKFGQPYPPEAYKR